jgi:preprotein translocase subunit SecE
VLGVRIPPGLPFYVESFALPDIAAGQVLVPIWSHMKTKNQKAKKKKTEKSGQKDAGVKQKLSPDKSPSTSKSVSKPSPAKSPVRKVTEKKGETKASIGQYVRKSGQFLREAKMELKRVKWPTRKELLATTAVVIVFVLFCALFLGLVDFGLIKLIKNIVG